MEVPWKVIFAFVAVFIAGAVFGGVFTVGVSARRVNGNPRLATKVEGLTPVPVAPKTQTAGPQLPNQFVARGNPITPQLMNQFTKRIPNITADQKESLKKILGRAGEDYHRMRQENLANVARVTERMYADVASVLTLEQRGELEVMRKQLEERIQTEGRKRAEAAAAENANRAKEQASRGKDGSPGPE